MTDEQYNRAIQINSRLEELRKVKEEITPSCKHLLTYATVMAGGEHELCYRNYMSLIGTLLDKHDEMIRQEIDEEIAKLKAEIETL